MNKSSLILGTSAILIAAIIMIPASVHAGNYITKAPLDHDNIIQQTTTMMTIPSDNTLPWGTVSGGPSEHVTQYPVIIQFYKDTVPIHFAQIDANEDGSYEYKFRVGSFDYNTDQFENYFEGDYTVKIFKVISN